MSTVTTVDTTASRQWAERPDDQRFLTLQELGDSVRSRKSQSWTCTPTLSDMRVVPERDLPVEVYDPTAGQRRLLKPTNWSFSQLSGLIGAPASYMRKLPAELAAINLQWGLEHSPKSDALLLGQTNGHNELRAITSSSYGRIWDSQVVAAVERVNQSGRWQIPAATYATTNPKRATTLYASDRDVFIFLVDPKNPVTIGTETLFRGFYTWNSEVGAATFGLRTFLYRTVCDNRMIWGATEVRELRIRHTSGAPDRFAYEGQRYLARYAEESTDKLVEGIQRAQNAKPEVNEGKGETIADWLQKRGLTKGQAKASVESANAEEGQARSVWDLVNGVTAYARSIRNTDDRIKVELVAGKIMEDVAK